MAIKDELLEQLLEGYQKPEDLLGEGGIFQELKKALIEKALGAELTQHPGHERGDPAGRGQGGQGCGEQGGAHGRACVAGLRGSLSYNGAGAGDYGKGGSPHPTGRSGLRKRESAWWQEAKLEAWTWRGGPTSTVMREKRVGN